MSKVNRDIISLDAVTEEQWEDLREAVMQMIRDGNFDSDPIKCCAFVIIDSMVHDELGTIPERLPSQSLH